MCFKPVTSFSKCHCFLEKHNYRQIYSFQFFHHISWHCHCVSMHGKKYHSAALTPTFHVTLPPFALKQLKQFKLNLLSGIINSIHHFCFKLFTNECAESDWLCSDVKSMKLEDIKVNYIYLGLLFNYTYIQLF